MVTAGRRLYSFRDAADIIRFSYFALLGLISAMGIVELILLHFERETWLKRGEIASSLIQAFAILLLIATRQPYVASLLFLYFVIKVFLLRKGGWSGKTPEIPWKTLLTPNVSNRFASVTFGFLYIFLSGAKV